ncbi:MAG: hypothetical protein ACKOW9_06605 [Candidatus Paceibacterota bacterium]
MPGLIKRDYLTNYHSVHPDLTGKLKPTNIRMDIPSYETCTFCTMSNTRNSHSANDGTNDREILDQRPTAFLVPNKYSLFSNDSNFLAITEKHASSIEDLTLNELTDLFTIIQRKYLSLSPSPFAFINVGLQAGGSNPHLHSQIVDTPFKPNAALLALRDHEPIKKDIRRSKEENLILIQEQNVTAYVPSSPTVSGEVRLASSSLDYALPVLKHLLSSISSKHRWAYNLIPTFSHVPSSNAPTLLLQWLPRFDQGTIYQLYFQTAVQSINSKEYAAMIRDTL